MIEKRTITIYYYSYPLNLYMYKNILILDLYKVANYRISKDTSGGYGTGNNFGYSFIPKLLMKLLKKNSEWPPLFAAYTYSALKTKGYEVEYKKNLPKDFNKYDLFIIVSSIVCSETEILEIAKLKKLNKKIFAIGPFATNMPHLYTAAGATVISGEPEFYFMKDQNFDEDLNKKVVNVNYDILLDDLPYPKWHEMDVELLNIKLYGDYKTIPIIATRGCPFSCSKYCVYPLQQGTKVRQRSVKKIVDEMEYWKKRHSVNMFVFRDPVFSINKKHTLEFCDELINRKIKINFVIETHLKILNSNLILKLKEAGLSAVKVGVESADSEVLKNESRYTVGKDEQLEKIRELENNKIKVSAMYIIGFPSDSEKTINNTINYAKKLNTTYAQFSVWTPYPGTPVFKEYNNKITEEKYENFDQYRLVYKHNIFDKKKIRFFLNKAYSKYYSRLNWFFKYLFFFYIAK